jgi:RHS repeat-associated protein
MRSGRVYYLNGSNNDLGYEKEVTDSGMTEHKHYLSAGGMVFAMQITRSGNLAQGGSAKPAENLQYLHTDHLGSVAIVTDQDGSVTERLAYDPWGKRRFPNGTADTNDSIIGLTLDRGFTMHEHLDEMGLIHMNGRIYDPLIGRFMSADPFIQAPDNLQSHNRFAYVMNNPLSMADPSGYFSWKKFVKKVLRPILAIAVAWFAPQFLATYGFAGASPALAGFVNAAATGFLAGAVSSGDLKGALISAFTAGLFNLAGMVPGADSFERYLAHAAAGCVSSVAGGGQCGSGAVSAVFGKYSTNWMNDTFGKDLSFGRGVAAAVAGGVGSVLGGGKFENGAKTAAFGYLFNQVASGLRGGMMGRPSLAGSPGAPMQNSGNPELADIRGNTDVTTAAPDSGVKGLYGPFHRLDSAPVVALIVGSGEVWGTNPRNSVFSEIPSVKAYSGPLPTGLVGTEFYTDVAPTNGHPTMPRWTLSPGVTPVPGTNFIRMPVRVSNYRLINGE